MPKNENAVINLNKQETKNESKIEVIKNLIFGDHIKVYDAEFEALKDDILKKKRILEEMVDDVRIGLQKSLDDVAIDANIRITELEERLADKIDVLEEETVNREILGKLLIDLGEKVKNK